LAPKPPFILAALVLVIGCRRHAPDSEHGQPSTPASANHGVLVARVGRVELHEDDLERMMARDPGASAHRFDTAAARRELVDGMVRFELLAQAADRAGLMQDPDAIHAQQQIAVTKLVNRTLGSVSTPDSITKEDVERDYQARQATDFTLPAAARVRLIHVAEQALATRVLAQAKALAPEDDAGFAALATKFSDDAATRAAGGDLGFIDPHSPLPPPLVEAALKLRAPGEIAGPVEVDGGYDILRLVTLRAAAVSPLSSVEASIRQRLYRERRAKALEDFMAKLRAETPVEVVEPKPAVVGAR
jgi:parvulin-like peptidyl-prolyl isomerase